MNKIELKEEITELDKEKIATFIAFQRLRVPDFSKRIQEMTNKMTKAVNKRLYSNEKLTTKYIEKYNKEKRTAIDPKAFFELVKNEDYFIQMNREGEIQLMMASVKDHFNYFMQMEWRIVFAPVNSAFVVSDNPFIIFSPSEHNPYRGVGIITPGVVKLIPLSKNFYIALLDKGNKITSHNAIREHCKFINDHIALNCDRFVYSHSLPLLKSIIERTKLKERPERIRVEVNN